MMFRLVFLIVAVNCYTTPGKFYGYQVFEIIPETIYQISWLHDLSKKHINVLDFWSIPRIPNSRVKVMVSPYFHKELKKMLKEMGINFKIVIKDASKFYRLERGEFTMESKNLLNKNGFIKYLNYDEIMSYLDHVSFMNPDQVLVNKAGQSFENRDIKTVLITNGDGNANKNLIFIEAGMHAREWISIAAALHIISQLTNNYLNNSKLIQNFDWLILPISNPDGYVYSHTKDRFWRKTRRPNANSKCAGTDIDHNFNFHWGSNNCTAEPCNENYCGVNAFSEPESMIIRDIMNNYRARCKMYLSLHSYGSYLLYPWSWTKELPEKWKILDDVARSGRDAIRAYNGKIYHIGSMNKVLHSSFGSSIDYAFGEIKIPISIMMQLSFGGTGFDPDPNEIRPLISEAWVGIQAMAMRVHEKFSEPTNPE